MQVWHRHFAAGGTQKVGFVDWFLPSLRIEKLTTSVILLHKCCHKSMTGNQGLPLTTIPTPVPSLAFSVLLLTISARESGAVSVSRALKLMLLSV